MNILFVFVSDAMRMSPFEWNCSMSFISVVVVSPYHVPLMFARCADVHVSVCLVVRL
jgi:hypothetical protein